MSPLRATILIAAMSIASKILGAIRQAVFANRFGAGQEMDIYVAAFRFPDLLFNLLILGTLSVAFIPVFVEYLHRDKAQALEIASTVFNLTLLVMSGLAIAGFFLSPFLVKLIVPGFSQEAKAQTLLLTRIMMLSPLFFSLSSVLASILQAHKRFLLTSIAPLLYNLSIIAGVIFFYPSLGLSGLALGVIAGAFLHFIIQLPSSLRLGLGLFKKLNFFHPGVKKIGKLFLPRVLGMDLGQISLFFASIFASFQASGSLAVFYFAYDLETVPLGIFAVSFGIAVFPTLSEFFGKKDFFGLKDLLSRTIVQILFLMIPISVLILLLRAQIVRLILGAGHGTHFSFHDTKLTAQALGIFALSLFAQSLVPLLARGFYAMQNTVIPVISGLIAAGVNILLMIIFAHKWPGPEGLALAFTLAIILHMAIMFAFLHKRIGDLNDEFLILRIIKISIASAVMGIASYITLYLVAPLVNMQSYFGIFLQAFSATVVAVATYIGAGLLINLPETRGMVTVLKSWFFKFTKPFTTAIVDMFTDLR